MYRRENLEAIMEDLLGDFQFQDAMTDELVVTAYEYNSQEPRFYSKYFARMQPGIFDVSVDEATGASSSAPLYFDPKAITNAYGLSEL